MSVLPDVVDVTPEVFIGSPYSSFLMDGSAMSGLAGGEDMASGTFIGLLRSSLVMAGSSIIGLATEMKRDLQFSMDRYVHLLLRIGHLLVWLGR